MNCSSSEPLTLKIAKCRLISLLHYVCMTNAVEHASFLKFRGIMVAMRATHFRSRKTHALVSACRKTRYSVKLSVLASASHGARKLVSISMLHLHATSLCAVTEPLQ